MKDLIENSSLDLDGCGSCRAVASFSKYSPTGGREMTHPTGHDTGKVLPDMVECCP